MNQEYPDPALTALRTPPNSVEAEQSVLGGLLLDNNAWDRIADLVRLGDFYRLDHRLIFEHILKLIERSKPADVITVYDALQNSGKAEEVGGLAYLNAVAQHTPSASNIRRYAEIVRDKAVLRRLVTVSDEISTTALNPQGRDTKTILDEAEGKIFKIAEEGSRGNTGFRELQPVLAKVVERIDELYHRDSDSDITGIPTGFADLDGKTSGLQPGDLIIVAGRPSMGKAQPLDARIRTHTGWKAMGELALGDQLASIDGLPSEVTGLYPQGERPLFRVTFSDGRSTQCCEEHLWRMYSTGWEGPRVLSTASLMTLLAQTPRPHEMWVDCVSGDFGVTFDVPASRQFSDFFLGVPAQHLNATAPVRLQILKKLLNLDAPAGTINQADFRLDYSTENQRVATDICDLVRSLGGLCFVEKRQLQMVSGDVFTTPATVFDLSLQLGASCQPLFLSSITPTRSAQAQCISVSHASRTYITDDYIVTHNTAFSLNIGEHVAIDAGLPVAVFSMEMGAEQLAMRLLGSVGRLDQHRVRTGKLTDEDWPRLTNAVHKMQDAQLFIDETPALSSMELRARSRRLARQCGRLGLIIIDYLQLMGSSSPGENRATEISEISRSLKALAKELQCPVIALSQLNRSLEQRPNKRPVMSDLRESGAIEQDADVILFIYRDEVYNPDSPDKGTAEIIIGKQRNGPIGTVRVTFLGQYTKFENYTGAQPGDMY
jgi:replicative DNA helicase